MYNVRLRAVFVVVGYVYNVYTGSSGVDGEKSCSVTYLEAHAIGYRRTALPRRRVAPVGVRFKSTHTRAGKYTITCTQTDVYTRRRTLLQTNTHRVHESTVSVGVIAGAAATAAGPMFPFATCLAGSGIGRHPRWVITVPAQVSIQAYLTILYYCVVLIKLKPMLSV